MNKREQLARSWEANAEAWTDAVRRQRIPSRRHGTNAAVVDAVRERRPRRVLDVGCGEGWLVRTLAAHGIEAIGVDASAGLIKKARNDGGGPFHVLSYEEIPAAKLGEFDVAVCNFALLDEELAAPLAAIRPSIAQNGILLIQTVHPWSARGDEPYQDGWRTETFASFDADFAEPMPWYFRTLESWWRDLSESGYRVSDLREPVHDETGDPLSLLIAAAPRRST